MSEKLKMIKQEMVLCYGARCWITLEREKRLTGHHIIPLRENGLTIWENIALLSNDSHIMFNQLENYIPYIAKQLNGMFNELNRTYAPPTLDYQEEVNKILSLVPDYLKNNKRR